MDDQLSPRARGGDLDEGTREFHPEVVDFTRWFVDWWLRRGLRLALEADAEEGERGA